MGRLGWIRVDEEDVRSPSLLFYPTMEEPVDPWFGLPVFQLQFHYIMIFSADTREDMSWWVEISDQKYKVRTWSFTSQQFKTYLPWFKNYAPWLSFFDSNYISLFAPVDMKNGFTQFSPDLSITRMEQRVYIYLDNQMMVKIKPNGFLIPGVKGLEIIGTMSDKKLGDLTKEEVHSLIGSTSHKKVGSPRNSSAGTTWITREYASITWRVGEYWVN